MVKIDIKPLSVNDVWQGRRFKTPAYKTYQKSVLLLLPKLIIPQGNLKITFVVGYSNKNADIDNFLKPFLDILQLKYGFNDSLVYELVVKKEITDKRKEFITFEIETLK